MCDDSLTRGQPPISVTGHWRILSYDGEVYLLLLIIIFFFQKNHFFTFLFLKFQLILAIFQIFRKLKKNSRNIIGFIKIVQFVHCGLALLAKYSLQPVHTVDWLCPW